MLFHVSLTSVCVCMVKHSCQRMIVTGDDMGSSLPSSVLHAGLFTLLVYLRVDISRLLLLQCYNVPAKFIPIWINCIAMPYLGTDTRKG